MPGEADFLVEKLELVGRAKEDLYFRKLDQALIRKMREKAAEEAEEAKRLETLFAKVLVAVDFSPFCRKALEYASSIADRFGSGIIALHVIDQNVVKVRMSERHPERPFLLAGPSDVREEELELVIAEQREKAYVELQRFLPTRLAEHSLEMRVLVGHPHDRILETADKEAIDLIVMGTHGRTGLSRWVAGSIAERVVRLAPCGVLTVKDKATIAR